MRPYLKKKKKSKKGLVECLKQGVGPEFKPQYCKKKKAGNWACTSLTSHLGHFHIPL
jgi:hypothetical protein